MTVGIKMVESKKEKKLKQVFTFEYTITIHGEEKIKAGDKEIAINKMQKKLEDLMNIGYIIFPKVQVAVSSL